MFNISVLSEAADFSLFQRFGFQSGRTVNKFAGFAGCRRSFNGLYYITEGTNAYFSAVVEQEIDLGTHMLFIASVEDMEVLSEEPSASYTYYQAHIKPLPLPEKPSGAAGFAAIPMRGKSCRRISSARCASTRLRILKK